MHTEKLLTKTSVYQVPTINQMQVIYALCCLNEKQKKKKKTTLQLYVFQQRRHLLQQNSLLRLDIGILHYIELLEHHVHYLIMYSYILCSYEFLHGTNQCISLCGFCDM